VTSTANSLLAKIEDRTAVVGIVRRDYVGSPLAVAFAGAGYRVKRVDLSQEHVDGINRCESFIEDVTSERLAGLPRRIEATPDAAVLASCDAVSICMPTPLAKTGEPGISYILAAADEIPHYLHPGMVVVLEPTTFPGTPTEIVLPRLTGNGANLELGHDFFLCFSPECVDPGCADWTTRNTPKVIGGVTPQCLAMGQVLDRIALATPVPVSSPAASEMVKLPENTFRWTLIG
jgi:UDP-N-acetyl-D-glucosamine dehydrogenase